MFKISGATFTFIKVSIVSNEDLLLPIVGLFYVMIYWYTKNSSQVYNNNYVGYPEGSDVDTKVPIHRLFPFLNIQM